MIGTILRAWDSALLNAVEWRLRRSHKSIYDAFERHYGHRPRISAPGNTSELIQWRKVFDHNPLFPVFSDKLATKGWAASKDPRVKTAPVLWSGKHPKEIPLELIDANVVIKTNHGSTFNYSPGEDGSFDFDEAVEKLTTWMSIDYSKLYDEWSYSRVPRLCFVERRVAARKDILELGFRCIDGACAVVTINLNEKTDAVQRGDFYPDGNVMPSTEYTLPSSFPLPEKYFEARDLAEKLSKGVDFVRVDFIFSGGDYYLSEMTVYPRAGYGAEDKAAEIIFAAWLKSIGRSWYLSAKPHSFLSSLYRNAVERHFRRMTGVSDKQEYAFAKAPADVSARLTAAE